MAKFRFGHFVNIHWNGYDIKGDTGTIFSIPDQLYEEFEGDFRPVEPSLEWTDTNEFLTLSNSVSGASINGTAPISVATTTAGQFISIASTTNPAGYSLVSNGSGGVIFQAGSTGSINSVIGVSPISATISGSTVSVGLNANYQTAGTYVTGVVGTSPISATGTTAITVSIDQSSLSSADAVTASTLRTYVKNSSGGTITKGQAVYVTGADGTNALIGLASSTSEATSSKTLGIAANTMTNNAFGYVIENGQLSNIDTSAATAGSSVWLGATPGSLAFNTPPTDPNNSVYLGVVTKANPSTGEILVKVQNGYELNELHDVNISGLANGQALVYNSSQTAWVNQSPTSASTSTPGIVQLTDSTSTTSSTVAATATAVKSAYDLANAAVPKSTVTTAGDIVYATGSATVTRLGIGTAGQVLTVAAGATSPAWATAASGGGGFHVDISGALAGTALGLTSGAYDVTNLGPDSSITISSEQRLFPTNTTRRITATSDIGSIGVAKGVNWTVRANGTAFGNMRGFAYGNGMYVVTGDAGSLSASPDAINWAPRYSGFGTSDINSAVYGSALFVIAGNTGKLSTSIDGNLWTARTSGFGSSQINAVGYGNGVYVAGGATGLMTTSTDGTTWTSRTSGFGTAAVQAIAYGNGLYVAGGFAGVLTTSINATGWTSRTSGFGTSSINGIAYGNGVFVAVGNAGKVTTSTDGTTWTTRTSGFSGSTINGVVFGDGLFVAVGADGKLSTSTDGITWTIRNPNIDPGIQNFGVGYGDGVYFTGAATGTYTQMSTSTNGLSKILFTPITYSTKP